MQRLFSLGFILVVLIGILYACNTPTNPTQPVLPENPALNLQVQAGSGTYNAVGQIIPYQYAVTNSGGTVLAGPVAISDDKNQVTCPPVNTVGDLNDNLDPGERVDCTSAYTITQADLNAGSVASNATASAGGIQSNTATTTVAMTPSQVLELTITASPNTYSNAGVVISFSYILRNTGGNTLGPAQFVMRDDRLGTINCAGADTTLAPGASISCGATYTTSESDRTVNELVFTANASGGGAAGIQPVQVKVTNTSVPVPPSGNYTPGTTVRHDVIPGEWMLQIARCYGADFTALRNANPQVKDPAKIWPIDTLTVPNIGSNGRIYGPPCIEYITAQSNDTWESIASRYNARVDVLKEANLGLSQVGGARIRVPLNSAGGNQTPVPNEPIRLNFSGSNKVTLSGTVTASKLRERYILTASRDYTLTVTLTAPTGGLELAVLASNGTALKAQNATLTYSGAIPANGDYLIHIVNVTNTERQYTLEVVLTPPTSAASRVADINAGAADSNPAHLAVFNNALYFNATGNDNAGAELWRFDGANVNRVADIFPGAEGSNPAYLSEFNGQLYFSANGNDGAGVELWRFNGNAVGRLTDINTGAGNANPSFMTVYNGRLYFSAESNDGTGIELWQTDGDTYGRAADIYSGSGNSNPSHLAVYNGALYFSATSNDGAGTELWKYDGASATRVTDINPGVGNASPAYLTVFNNILYFSANANDGAGTELWKFDGTNASRAADINPGAGDSVPAYLTFFNNALYFGANGNDGAGYELWKFDGSTASRASDINPSGDSMPSFLRVFNNELYFQANGGDGAGRELWKFRAP